MLNLILLLESREFVAGGMMEIEDQCSDSQLGAAIRNPDMERLDNLRNHRLPGDAGDCAEPTSLWRETDKLTHEVNVEV